MSLRTRLVISAAAAAGVVLLVVLFLATPSLHRRALEQSKATLLAEARLVARVVQQALAQGTAPGALDSLVDEAAREAQARVTIVAPDGRVLADSTASGPDLQALENLAGRPEVQAAPGSRSPRIPCKRRSESCGGQ
jgi:two-component system, OmpR family, phosphate regulon sensor histidine kinase PhoR